MHWKALSNPVRSRRAEQDDLGCLLARSEAEHSAPGATVVPHPVGQVLRSSAALAEASADRVYTGKGAVIWMPDLSEWARGIARLLRPSGHLFVCEEHPASVLWTWDEDHPRIREDRSHFPRSHVNDTFPAREAAVAVDSRSGCHRRRLRRPADRPPGRIPRAILAHGRRFGSGVERPPAELLHPARPLDTVNSQGRFPPSKPTGACDARF
jgi:hypothetical protein